MAERTDTIEVMQTKYARGEVLSLLRSTYPDALNVVVIDTFLSRIGYKKSREAFRRLLAWLEERGLIETAEAKGIAGFKVQTARITDKGIDVLEGTTHDEGVGFHE